MVLALVLLALALARSAWQVRGGHAWRVVLRANLIVAGITAVAVPALVAGAIGVVLVGMHQQPRIEQREAGRWLGSICAGPAGERGRDLERVLSALVVPRPDAMQAPKREALLSSLRRCLYGLDPAELASDRPTLDRIFQTLRSRDSAVVPSPERHAETRALGTLTWLLHGPDLRTASLACGHSTCVESALGSAAAWCRRRPESCRQQISIADVDWFESGDGAKLLRGESRSALWDLTRVLGAAEDRAPP